MTYKEILNSLANEGSVRTINDKELIDLKDLMLSCYKDLAKVCNKYNLSLMLSGGSCLGAVRHKGYIPWDDDFDVMMFRCDFDKLQTVFKEELSDKYILNAPNYSNNPSNRFPKVLIKGTRFVEIGGRNDETDKIKIDIFIIENVPNNRFYRFLRGINCSLLMYIASCVDIYECRNSPSQLLLKKSIEGRKLRRRRLPIGFIFSFFSYTKWCNIVDSACHYRKNSKIVSIPSGRKHYFGEMLPLDVFSPSSKGIFEGLDVELPNKPDIYLSNLYGDYMTIPPEEKREKHLIRDIAFDAE